MEIVNLAEGFGGCLATNRVAIDRMPIGYCYREDPANPMDSGWRFFAGDESPEYMANNNNHAVYAVNTIANFDPSILSILDAPAGSAFDRTTDGWAAVTDDGP